MRLIDAPMLLGHVSSQPGGEELHCAFLATRLGWNLTVRRTGPVTRRGRTPSIPCKLAKKV